MGVTAATTANAVLTQSTALPGSSIADGSSDVPESSQKGGFQKSKGKPYCYRCHTKGHTISVCTAVLSCEICFGDHVKKVCPNLKSLHSTALPCGYVVEGLGFYFIPIAENPKIPSDDKSAVVRVLEGSLTADQLAVELDKLLPGNSWVIDEKGNDAFTTNFPSSEVLNHMVNWGPMDTKTVKGKIRFEKEAENDVFKYEIDKVWVQFRGLPKELQEFPIIWAIGSILGVSRVVDTKFTKKHGRARMKVAVLNSDLIPDLVDVVIGEYVYELQFRVEKDMSDGEPQVIDMDSTMDEDKAPKEKEPENMDHDANKTGDPPAGQLSDKQPNASVAPSGQHMNKATAGAPTDLHMGNDMTDQPDLPLEADIQQGVEVGAGVILQQKNTNKPVVSLSQTGMSPDGTAQWKASLMQSKSDSGLLKKSKALSGGAVSPVRASKRNAFNSDQDSLEKATKLKARKNLESSSIKGKETRPLSFDAIDDSILLASTSALGISLGSNEQEVSLSLKSLKDLESLRLSENFNLEVTNKILVDDVSSVCSLEENMDLDALNLICAEITEDLSDGGCDPLCLQTPLSHFKKSKSSLNKKKAKRRSK
jgi:hypothetical protein